MGEHTHESDFEQAFGEDGVATDWLTSGLSFDHEDNNRHLSVGSLDDELVYFESELAAMEEEESVRERFTQRSQSLSPLSFVTRESLKRLNPALDHIPEGEHEALMADSYALENFRLSLLTNTSCSERVSLEEHMRPERLASPYYQYIHDETGLEETLSNCSESIAPFLDDTVDPRRRHSVVGMQTYACPFPGCHRFFSRTYNLRSHYLIHSGGKPHICEHCGLSFARNHDLRRHIRIHNGQKPFSCIRCMKGFSRQDALDRHRKSSSRCNSASSVVTGSSSLGSP